MDMVRYMLINKEDNRVVSKLDMPIGETLTWHYPTDEYFMIAADEDLDDTRDWDDYVYDPETGKISLEPRNETFDYVDLKTGAKRTMTTTEFEEMVDERVKNLVQATIREMIEDQKSGLVVPVQTK